MSFLEYYVNDYVINKINDKYNKRIISSIIYNQDNVIKVIKYFKSLDLEIENLLINRLDIFLINFDKLKNNISLINELLKV